MGVRAPEERRGEGSGLWDVTLGFPGSGVCWTSEYTQALCRTYREAGASTPHLGTEDARALAAEEHTCGKRLRVYFS